jgi:3-deoxy-D-arabino-heptulosonate 7-phosphate (DAHP) synthase class II
MKPEYDLKSLKRTDPSRVREIMANSEPTVNVIRADGSSCMASLEPSFVRLEADVAEAFPTATAVNEALRLLMRLVKSDLPRIN